MRYRITLEVDQSRLFDMAHKCGQQDIAARLFEACLCPENAGVMCAIGLAAYGITVGKAEAVDHPHD